MKDNSFVENKSEVNIGYSNLLLLHIMLFLEEGYIKLGKLGHTVQEIYTRHFFFLYKD